VEPGEALGEAITREVREETNLDTRVVCELGAVTIARERAVYVIHEHLVVPLDDRAPRAGDDAAEARWVSRAEVEAFGVQPDAVAVIDQALREAAARGLWAAALTIVTLVSIALGGCAHVLPPPSAPPSADAALARMHATFACANAVQASAKIDHIGREGRVRGELLLFAARPARMRMDVVSPFGVALATLTSDGERFGLVDTRNRRMFVGPASACNIARLTTVAIPGHVLVDLFRGEAPVLKHETDATSIAWDPRGYWVLTVTAPARAGRLTAREDIRLTPRPEDWKVPWQEQRMRVLDVRVEEGGYPLYHAELSDHAPAPTAGPREDPDHIEPTLPPSGPACDAEVPRKIHVEVTAPPSDVRFLYRDIQWNPPLAEGIFDPSGSGSMPVESVTCD
jgi:hypothetical protein